MEENRFTEIERENRILLEKITCIMKNKQDVRQQQALQPIAPRSMNQFVRRNELQKIAKENYYLYKRINDKKPSIQMQRLDDNWRDNQNYMFNIQQHRFNGMSPTSSSGQTFYQRLRASTSQNRNRNSQQNYFLSESLNTKKQKLTKSKRLHPQSQSNSLDMKSQDLSFSKKSKKMTIYKKTRKIGGEYFTVEIYFQKGKLFIVADEVEGSQTKIIEIPENDAYKFLKEECDNDIESLVLRLRLQNDKLYLIGTKPVNTSEQESRNNLLNIENQTKVTSEKIQQSQGLHIDQESKRHQQQNVLGDSKQNLKPQHVYLDKISQKENLQVLPELKQSGSEEEEKTAFEKNNNQNAGYEMHPDDMKYQSEHSDNETDSQQDLEKSQKINQEEGVYKVNPQENEQNQGQQKLNNENQNLNYQFI